MKIRKRFISVFSLFISFIILILLIGSGCRNINESSGDDGNLVRTPVLNSISPSSTLATTINLTLKAIGVDFSKQAKIFFNGSEKQTSFISSSELQCVLSNEDTIVDNNSFPKSISVSVANPQSNSSYIHSQTLEFTLYKNNTFSQHLELDNQGDISSWDVLCDSQDNVYIYWDDADGAHLIMSTNKGSNWTQVTVDERINGNGKMIIDKNNHLYIAWINRQDGVFFSRSTDGGNHWSRPGRIKKKGEDLCHINIAVRPGGTVVVFWRHENPAGSDKDNYLFYSYSTDNGQNWSDYSKLCDGRMHRLHYAGQNDQFYLVYDYLTPENNWRNYFAESPDGINWESPTIVTHTHDPVIVSDNKGNLSIVCAGDDLSWYYLRSIDQGMSWQGPMNIPPSPTGGTHRPDITMDSDGNPHVVWMGVTDNIDTNINANIFYSQSGHNGENWTDPINISNMKGSFIYPGPKIVIDSSDTVYIIWAITTTSGPGILYFSRSQN